MTAACSSRVSSNPQIAILDYDAGNVTSVLRAVAHLGYQATITADPACIARADKVIFPGVGAAASCMESLRSRGVDAALREAIAAGTDVLGICVGMQLLFDHSDEDGGVACLGLLPGTVRQFVPTDAALKVPHMGWNTLQSADADTPQQTDRLLRGIAADAHFYFVHSYYCAPSEPSSVMVQCTHGQAFCAGVRHENLAAVQFHPEKSGAVGLQFLQNFVDA